MTAERLEVEETNNFKKISTLVRYYLGKYLNTQIFNTGKHGEKSSV